MTPAPTREPGEATTLARRAASEGVDLVIGWGGDGTLNEIVRGLVHSQSVLGVLPGGTVNVFAREVGIPFGVERACDAIVRGRRHRIALGSAGGRPFLLMAGVGLDAAVVERLGLAMKRGLGVTSFWIEGLKQLVQYDLAPFLVRAEGREYRATTAIVGKMRLFGPGYVITPDAGIDVPHLDVVLFQGTRRRDYLRYLAGVLAGTHTGFADVVHFHATALDVEGSPSLPHQLDGEAAGIGPVRIEVLPDALEVVLPG